jgi:hypothetical protein
VGSRDDLENSVLDSAAFNLAIQFPDKLSVMRIACREQRDIVFFVYGDAWLGEAFLRPSEPLGAR